MSKMKDGSYLRAVQNASTDNGKELQGIMDDVYNQSDFWDDMGDWF
jgi:hypothetical protein